ncbi:hypothetical protein CTAYLR_009859 [Chrysophaeum taylorii]|uniref:RRM domain-containing protein n=1 Tax=Chrysophaeum taylorii TaxID=2483200 RepID=A0AAD7U7N8_9STRA|nr:hypothetical protein CTAYLR_009859 [Chrysophaeum taylorii]
MKENPSLSVPEALAKLQIMKQTSGMPAGNQVAAAGGTPLGGIASALGATPAAIAAASMPASLQQSKSQREVYVSGLPVGVTSSQLQEFLTTALKEVTSRDVKSAPVVNTWLSGDGKVGFCEARTVDDAAELIEYCDGLDFSGARLQIGKPRAASDPVATDPALMAQAPLVVSSNVVMLLNVPTHLSETEILDFLVSPFGDVQDFNVLRDVAGESKGSVVFRYANDKVTSAAVAALAGLRLGDETLDVQRVPPSMINTLLKPIKPGELAPAAPHDPSQPSPIICFRNVVDDDDLADDQAYAELADDILEECARYATVANVVVPRPSTPTPPVITRKNKRRCSGLGLILVEFESSEDAEKALNALRSRAVDDKPVDVAFYPRDLYKQKIYHSAPLPTISFPPATAAPDASAGPPLPVLGLPLADAAVAAPSAAPILLAPPPPPPPFQPDKIAGVVNEDVD